MATGARAALQTHCCICYQPPSVGSPSLWRTRRQSSRSALGPCPPLRANVWSLTTSITGKRLAAGPSQGCRTSTGPIGRPMVGGPTASWDAQATATAQPLPAAPGVLRVYYHRPSRDYNGWGLHTWGDVVTETSWDSAMAPTGLDAFGVYWDIVAREGASSVNVLVHRGDEKDCLAEVAVGQGIAEAWLVSSNTQLFLQRPDLGFIPQGDIGSDRGFWVTRDILAWNGPANGLQFSLHWSETGSLTLTNAGIEGGGRPIQLDWDPNGLPHEIKERFPHIASYSALRIHGHADVPRLLKSQLALAVSRAGAPLDATGLQVAGVLDDVFARNAQLGPVVESDSVSVSVWAPTARSVRLLIFSAPSGGSAEEVVVMVEKSGVWSVNGPVTWTGKYYLFEVVAFHYVSRRFETMLSTDPYSRGLSANGERSLICDLNDPALIPEGWGALASEKRPIQHPTDISIYELHIRDFSAIDETVSPELRGSYLAFTSSESNGVKHLRALADAGLTHLHLLPSYDFATVDERKERWQWTGDLSHHRSDSEEQQAAVVAVQNFDAYNWGYDPVHFGVPDGSYASNPDGPQRTLEFRKMVQAINRMGLRVVLDVVYNHVYGSGPTSSFANLDKIVPGYYLRRSATGEVESSTCMNNTASEHRMMSRLIVDDLVHWVVNYKVDGFRFDLMGHIMKSTLLEARDRLRQLTVHMDGVDGSSLYLYGEGWNFGEVINNSRGVTGAQRNMAGTGIGSFNDRLRDMGMGGSPFGDPLVQGFLTGLLVDPNELHQGSAEEQERALRAETDCIQLSLAGNLRDFSLTTHTGARMRGEEIIIYDGVPCGYTASPEEIVNYVSAHDNETLFDNFIMKMSRGASMDDRCRMNHMATALVALAQGVPFFHAGDDVLRSKSLDRDSYNSGDWFNRLDFSYSFNNWGVGLPPWEKNGHRWEFMRSRLADPAFAVSREQILRAVENMREMLRIRYSSPLFRLRSGMAVQERVSFHNVGPHALPGVIVLGIIDQGDRAQHMERLDDKFEEIVVFFNARPSGVNLAVPHYTHRPLSLHPVLTQSGEEVVKGAYFDSNEATFTVPARTTAVFVKFR